MTLEDLFDTSREAELGAIEALQGHAWAEDDPTRRVWVYERGAQTFVSSPYIGTQGVLMDGARGTRVTLGSGIDAALQVWAYRLGVDLDGTNDVLVRAFTDQPRLEVLLGRVYTRRQVVRSIRPHLNDLPLMLRGVRLYRAIPELYEAWRDGSIVFELDPVGTRSEADHHTKS